MPVHAALIMKCEDCLRFVITASLRSSLAPGGKSFFPDPQDSGWELVWIAHPPGHICRCPHHRKVNPEPLPPTRTDNATTTGAVGT